ncbi:MAG TPA: phosphoribosylpyrophosphate synthetase, partial [bacterium]|nr:phosphoribosylpyrophosphate synthetase [bacterium]
SCTHAVLSGQARKVLGASPLKEVIITDTIPQTDLPACMKILSVANLLGEAIKCIHLETSVSSLFL